MTYSDKKISTVFIELLCTICLWDKTYSADKKYYFGIATNSMISIWLKPIIEDSPYLLKHIERFTLFRRTVTWKTTAHFLQISICGKDSPTVSFPKDLSSRYNTLQSFSTPCFNSTQTTKSSYDERHIRMML